MKINTKSSITLPPKELKLVEELQRSLGAKSKVEVVRRGLYKLKESADRERLKAGYIRAAEATNKVTHEELADLEGLTSEGLD